MARIKIEKNLYYDDKKKMYYVNMDHGKDESGKRLKIAKTFKKKNEAKECLRRFLADKYNGTLVLPNNASLSDWLNYWMENIISSKCEVTTKYGYENIINNHIIPFLGKFPIQKINALQIQKYYTYLSNTKNLSLGTIRKHHDLLNSALKIAVKQEGLSINPIDKVDPPKPKMKEANFYDVEMLKKLFELIKGHRLELPVKIACLMGLRREEVCGLKWGNIDFVQHKMIISKARTMAGSTIVEKDTKTISSNRVLYIPDDVYNLLISEHEKQTADRENLLGFYEDNDYVIVMENGKPYRPNYISELFSGFIKNNKLPKLNFHGLRHTFATIANASHISLYDTSKILGHSSMSITTKIYTHIKDKTHKEPLTKISANFENNKDK